MLIEIPLLPRTFVILLTLTWHRHPLRERRLVFPIVVVTLVQPPVLLVLVIRSRAGRGHDIHDIHRRRPLRLGVGLLGRVRVRVQFLWEIKAKTLMLDGVSPNRRPLSNDVSCRLCLDAARSRVGGRVGGGPMAAAGTCSVYWGTCLS